ncbi:glucan biosynthesis: glycosyl transferase [Georgfuchsia toluolica]|uniref:Glucans biosynthesis glucosyltransferase H n=1 Tax=Georgfuchsia toluolica TaxID=424218 RepID=A0A916N8A9_9PROT|nr:glucans biosynthesis glucosyltransferase MdoH [Georgfuchsia toluolica]CAG4882381.1 glucan biosynthesis: glycosyl transferase [Georgfuchsia toluolica]
MELHPPARMMPCAPPIRRSSMAPAAWPPDNAGKARPCDASPSPIIHMLQPRMRRCVLLALIFGQSFLATHFMRQVLPYHGAQPLEIAVLTLFALLFLWVSAGFWTALMGFLQLLRGDRNLISRHGLGDTPMPATARTAIVMPICNEDVARVFAGLRATYRSLAEMEYLPHFDFYVLSDSSEVDCRVAELAAWADMRRDCDAAGRLFYRWRRHRIKKKSGNVADFCRRWGRNYEYMVVLDADSVMSGDCLATLVRLMEAHSDTGIIQTAPHTAGRDTLYARMQQFASRVYGPLFVAGLYFWQLGESHYWGHNAIIRIAPFMRHCALGRLPGRGALSGEILSHDFVEAALMRRAGWAVWIAYDLPGSYEESPPTLIDDLKRDRRWCYGNLMNFRLFPEPGLHPVHRAVFVTGAFSYVSAPLWFLFLICSTALLASHTLIEPQYFIVPNQMFPLWPEWNPQRALALFSATAALLFAPKLLSFLLIALREPARFGGRLALASGMLAESLFSALLAPIRMIFHTQFVCAALAGRSIRWKSPLRDDAETGWCEALNWHGLHMLLGIGWAGLICWLNPASLYWLLPILGAWLLAVPISVFSSRRDAGRLLRRIKLLLIPEEMDMPPELRWMRSALAASPRQPGLVDAAMDPRLNALARACGRARQTTGAEAMARQRALVERAIEVGPAGLDAREKNALLDDPLALSQLHSRLRRWPAPDSHPDWHGGVRTVSPADYLPATVEPQAALCS